MSKGTCLLMSTEAVDFKVRIFVCTTNICTVMMIAGHLDVLVFRSVLGCSVACCGGIFFGVGLGLMVSGTRLLRSDRGIDECPCEKER